MRETSVTPARLLGFVVMCLVGLSACGAPARPVATFKNPVYKPDFPDPFALKVGKTYYAYATSPSGGGAYVPELTSRDLVHWSDAGDAMPIPPRWADTFWAPAVIRLRNGRYAMYFSGHDPQLGAAGSFCLGVAVSKTPGGPFKDVHDRPLLCQTGLGGTIDPDAFADGGKLYLYFKNNGNCCGIPTHIWVQQLSPDGTALIGRRVSLLVNDQAWEGTVIEAPDMWKENGKYYLFFSGNGYNTPEYAVGYAVCRGPMGPCQEARNNPILQYKFGGCDAEGPGSETIVADAQGHTWMLFHAWSNGETDYNVGGQRSLWLDRLDWKNGQPVVEGPDCKRQPAPAT